MARAPGIAGLESRLQAEFRADWSDRQKALDLALQTASSAFSVKGLGRSGPLLREHTRLLEEALADARSLLLQRVPRVLAALDLGAEDLTVRTSLRAVIGAEVTRLATDFDQLLTREAASMGFSNTLGCSVHGKQKALLTTLDTELDGTLKLLVRETKARVIPWYQRPVGYIVLTVIAGVLVWLLVAKVFGP